VTRRRLGLAAVLALVFMALSMGSSRAQVLPPLLPELPPPPVEGNPLADLLGPLTGDTCDTVATVYALAGPIAQAQLPPELRSLVDEVTPYLSLVTYACGLLASPPTGTVCAADEAVKQQIGMLGLPLPLNAPPAVQVVVDTIAGIEHVFLRLGLDIGRDVSTQLAAALGCTVPAPVVDPPAAPAPSFPTSDLPSTPGVTGSPGSFSSGTFPSAPAGPVAVSAGGPLPGVPVTTTEVSYPIEGLTGVLLILPLALLAGLAVVAPRLSPITRARRQRSRP
jgi:hypothetical protein